MEESQNTSAHLIDDLQVAEMLSVEIVTVRRWRMTNQGPPFLKLGRSVYRYRTEDVLAWIGSRQRGGEILAEAQ
jgi:hypothetical protein